MSLLAGLLGAVLADPNADDVRLVYADALEESGQIGIADRIRHGVQYPDAAYCCEGDAETGLFCTSEHPCPLCGDLLSDGVPFAFLGEGKPGQPRYRVRRGFVDEVCCTAQVWSNCAGAILAVQPIREVRLTTWPELVWRNERENRRGVYWIRGHPELSTTMSFKEWEARMGEHPLHGWFVLAILTARWPHVRFTLRPGPADDYDVAHGDDFRFANQRYNSNPRAG